MARCGLELGRGVNDGAGNAHGCATPTHAVSIKVCVQRMPLAAPTMEARGWRRPTGLKKGAPFDFGFGEGEGTNLCV